jgi:hypothetical protein
LTAVENGRHDATVAVRQVYYHAGGKIDRHSLGEDAGLGWQMCESVDECRLLDGWPTDCAPFFLGDLQSQNGSLCHFLPGEVKEYRGRYCVFGKLLFLLVHLPENYFAGTEARNGHWQNMSRGDLRLPDTAIVLESFSGGACNCPDLEIQ